MTPISKDGSDVLMGGNGLDSYETGAQSDHVVIHPGNSLNHLNGDLLYIYDDIDKYQYGYYHDDLILTRSNNSSITLVDFFKENGYTMFLKPLNLREKNARLPVALKDNNAKDWNIFLREQYSMLTTTKSSLQKEISEPDFYYDRTSKKTLESKEYNNKKLQQEYIFEKLSKGKKQNNPNLTYALPLTAMQPAFKNSYLKNIKENQFVKAYQLTDKKDNSPIYNTKKVDYSFIKMATKRCNIDENEILNRLYPKKSSDIKYDSKGTAQLIYASDDVETHVFNLRQSKHYFNESAYHLNNDVIAISGKLSDQLNYLAVILFLRIKCCLLKNLERKQNWS